MAKQAETKRRLGKGLKALIPEKTAAVQERAADASAKGRVVREAAVEIIDPSPEQPRRNFSEEELHELADSIRK